MPHVLKERRRSHTLSSNAVTTPYDKAPALAQEFAVTQMDARSLLALRALLTPAMVLISVLSYSKSYHYMERSQSNI